LKTLWKSGDALSALVFDFNGQTDCKTICRRRALVCVWNDIFSETNLSFKRNLCMPEVWRPSHGALMAGRMTRALNHRRERGARKRHFLMIVKE
jgi:hypothetical protein